MSYTPPVVDHDSPPVWSPWVTLGVDIASPWATTHPAATWDRSRWNAEFSTWAGLEPNWATVVCDVTAAKITRGRGGSLERVPTSTATLTVQNDSGWASWSDHPDPDTSLGLRPGRAVRLTAQRADLSDDPATLWSGWLQAATENYPAAGEGPPTAELAAVDSLSRLALVDPLPVDPAVGAGESLDARLKRLCAIANWPVDRQSFEPSPVTLTGTKLSRNLLDEAQLAVESEGGILYGARNGDIASRTRDWLRLDPVATTVQATFTNHGEGWCPVSIGVDGPDVSNVANRVIVGREGGPAPVQFDDPDSQSLYGVRTWRRLDYLTDSDAQLDTLGRRRLIMGADPVRRIRALVIDPLADAPALFDFVLAVDYGWRLHVEYAHPSGAWGWAGDVHVHGVEHVVTHGSWRTTLRVEDASYWRAGSGWDRDDWSVGRWVGPLEPAAVALATTTRKVAQRWA